MDQRSDQELVEACRQGDRDAYASLVRKHSRRILAICYGVVGNPDDAEDLTQETLIRAFREIQSLRDPSQFFPWVRRIARNQCMDFFRRRKAGEVLVAEPPDKPDPHRGIDPRYLDLQAAIQKLPENLRSPLLFYYFDGQSTKNIAAALETGQAAVHTRLSRARRELRRLLTEKEDAK